MKRIGSLWPEIVDYSNVAFAVWRAARGKLQRPDIQRFLSNLEEERKSIVQELNDGTFQFQAYRRFKVRDSKSRIIHAPVFRDRVVHHAIMQVAGPWLDAGAIYHSYACRKGKGLHVALKAARKWTRRKGWYGKVDVRAFYDSIPHQLLMEQLERRFRDARLLLLFKQLLDSFHHSAGVGIPIGALTSQYLGNFFLDPVDRIILRDAPVRHYLRYMDDSFLWLESKKDLKIARDVAHSALAQRILSIKDGGEWNRCERGIPFLGFVVYPDRVRVGRKGRKRFRSKFAGLCRRYRQGQLGDTEFGGRSQSLFAHVGQADDRQWRRVILSLHDIGED